MSRGAVWAATLGCDKNLVDSEVLLGRFAAEGYAVADDPEDADVWVLNTCGFIEAARRDSYDAVEELCAEKGERLLVVMGCLTQERGEEIRRRYPDVDVVAGVGNFDRVVAAVAERAGSPTPTSPDEAVYEGFLERASLTPMHLAFLKISEGCNFRCGFCRIPMIRGDQRSRPITDLVAETRALLDRGVRELLVISQNTSDYGRDTGETLGDLIRAVGALDDGLWIRLLYLYPGLVARDDMRAILDVPGVLPYLDMPVQHASARMLKAMNRPFRSDRLREFFGELRDDRPDLVLRTTVLLGYPGEEEEDVEELLDFLAAVRFDHVGTYRYSPEAGTPGAALADACDPEEVLDREARVLDLQSEIAGDRQRARLGGTHEVVVDRIEPAGEWREILDELVAASDEHLGDLFASDDVRVAVARSRHQAPDIDGVTLLDGRGLRPGSRYETTFVSATPFDVLARPAAAGKGTP